VGIDTVVFIFFVLDIIFSKTCSIDRLEMLTTYDDPKSNEEKTKFSEIFLNYCSSGRFFVDVIATIPY
jgi:hypothetical protein